MNLERRLILRASIVKNLIAIVLLLGVGEGILIILQSRQLSQIVSNVLLGRHGLKQVMPIIWALICVVLIRTVISGSAEVVASKAAIRIKSHIRTELFERILFSGPSYLAGENTGELTTLLLEGIEGIESYFRNYFPNLVLAAVVPLFIALSIFPLDLVTEIIFMVTAPLIPLFMILIGGASEKMTRRQWLALSRLGIHYLDTLQGLETLKSFNRSKAQTSRISEVNENYRVETMAVLRVTFLSALVLDMVTAISIALVAVSIGLRLLYGRLGFEEAFFILVIAPEFYIPLRKLSLSYHAGTSGIAAAKRVFSLLDKPVPFPQDIVSSGSYPNWRLPNQFKLEVVNVSYQYPDWKNPALHKVSFNIISNQMTAILGITGSGKSTLIKILMRFLEPTEGEIYFNSLPIQSIPSDIWRKQIAWVPDRPYLFNGSISENIRIGKPSASHQEMVAAVQSACLEEDILQMPDQYDTQIGDRGVRLSAGQRQRLALARAFIKGAPFLILDEPTVHLDPDKDVELQKVVTKLLMDRTVLVVAHKVATVISAEQIILMKGGKVLETGNQSELRLKRGNYFEVVSESGMEG